MKPSLCISIRFIQPFPLFHGRADADEPEWPPSPMRVFQALLNSACLRTQGRLLSAELRFAIQVLEVVRPMIVAPRATLSLVGYRAYVPHNQFDLVTSAWYRGNVNASIASHRMEKDIHPYRIEVLGGELPTVHYYYPLEDTDADPIELLNTIRPAVRSIYSLGWGIDQVASDATLVEADSAFSSDECWTPTPRGGRRLRIHRDGSFDALSDRHERFLKRLDNGNWTPVPPFSAFDTVRYRRDSDPIPLPCAVFKLLDADDDTYSYSLSKLIHISGMVRHLAIEQMKLNPPRDLRDYSFDDWLGSYVAGHQTHENKAAKKPHSQFSFVPLPSIGHEHTDPSIRRVMVIAPLGDDAWLEHLCRQLDGELLKPLPNTSIPPGTHLELVRAGTKDGVRDRYTCATNSWASFTPVILPGHDDHKPDKTRKLIERTLAQSGIEQPCTFEWSAFSHFRKSFSAHKYDKDKRLIGYVRPDHLLNQTAVHLKLKFADDMKVPGPLTLGAGRHCGFGLMVGIDSNSESF